MSRQSQTIDDYGLALKKYRIYGRDSPVKIRYQKLLSPIQVGNVLLKNRMISTAGYPHMLQGSEDYPTEKVITHLSNRAKNGAAAVHLNFFMRGEVGGPPERPHEPVHGLWDADMHFQSHDNSSKINIVNNSSHNYLCQLIDSIRYYGSIAMTQPFGDYTRTDMPGEGPGKMPGGDFGDDFDHSDPERLLREEQGNCMGHPVDNITKSQMQEYIDTTVKNALALKSFGFEMFSLHHAYHNSLASDFWSQGNTRGDAYGGSVHNRARLMVELHDALRQALGPDFPIEVLLSVEGPGVCLEDTLELCRLLEGKVDIIHVRHGEKDPQHPVGYTSSRQTPCPNLDAAAALRAGLHAQGTKMLVGVSAGLQNPDFNEKILLDGKADLICMSRAWICDSQYGEKVYEGRGEDITPCIRCNKCHVPNASDTFRSFCSVNPKIGREEKVERMAKPVTRQKNVAVVGGGPAGMQAALTCAERGHHVTVYEKERRLGGQLFHADYPSFKWPLADYRDYMARQLYKAGVDVRLNTTATFEMLDGENYDDVIVAIGPSFKKPDIPGADGPNTMLAIDVYGREETLPKDIVVIGGSETGTETGMYLAEKGHQVTVMTRQGMLAEDAPHAHYVVMQMDAYEAMPNFRRIRYVKRYISIDSDGVRYVDQDGQEQMIPCQMVVLSGGVDPRPADAAAFYGAGLHTHYIGDCCRPGDVHKAVTAGYGIACQI